MIRLPNTRSCFVCGDSNPHGLKLSLETDGVKVWARFVPGPEHVGFARTIHGGLSATVLDEAMVWAIGVRERRFAYAAELTTRYLLPLFPGVPAIVEAELVANRRGKLYECRGEIRLETDASLRVSATGKYLPIPADRLPEMLAEFDTDPFGRLPSVPPG